MDRYRPFGKIEIVEACNGYTIEWESDLMANKGIFVFDTMEEALEFIAATVKRTKCL